MKILKTIVVGLGRIGWQVHVPEIVRHRGFELAAVADPSEERRMEAKNAYGCEACDTLEKALDSTKADLVVIASPTVFHEDQIKAAMSRGIDVFCDKPLSTDYASSVRIAEFMKGRSEKLMVFQPHRLNKEAQILKNVLAEGLLGDVYMVKRALSGFDQRNDWQAFLKNGGGMLNNYGAHMLDQFIYLFDEPFRRMSCVLRKIQSIGDAEDVAKVVIETDSGLVYDLDINMATAFPITPWQVFGTLGTMLLDMQGKCWKIKYCRPEDMKRPSLQESYAAEGRRYGSGLEIPWQEKTISFTEITTDPFYEYCYKYYAENQPPLVPLEDTLRVMKLLEDLRHISGTPTQMNVHR